MMTGDIPPLPWGGGRGDFGLEINGAGLPLLGRKQTTGTVTRPSPGEGGHLMSVLEDRDRDRGCFMRSTTLTTASLPGPRLLFWEVDPSLPIYC